MRIGFTNGCLDGLHTGHQYFLSIAKCSCDWLIVAVNSDASVRALKGADRPFHDLISRMRAIKVAGLADSVIPFDGDPVPLLQQIKPDVLIRGGDQSDEGREYAKELLRIPRVSGVSTTALYGRHLATFHHEGSKRKLVVLEDNREKGTNATD